MKYVAAAEVQVVALVQVSQLSRQSVQTLVATLFHLPTPQSSVQVFPPNKAKFVLHFEHSVANGPEQSSHFESHS